MKKYQKVVIVICFLLILGLCFLHVCNRGKIYITIDNQTADELTVVKINDQTVDKNIAANDRIKVRYQISSEGGVTLYLNQNGNTAEKEIVAYAGSGYYGKVRVIVKNTQEDYLHMEIEEKVYL